MHFIVSPVPIQVWAIPALALRCRWVLTDRSEWMDASCLPGLHSSCYYHIHNQGVCGRRDRTPTNQPAP